MKWQKKTGADKIAVGHHLNDQAETLLMNLIRGAGLEGLTGIPAIRGRIIRPLICCTRKEILSYCHHHNLPYRIDATNQETEYFRNKIRNHLIPEMESLQPNFIKSIGNSIELLDQDRNYFEKVVAEKFNNMILHKNEQYLILNYEKDLSRTSGCCLENSEESISLSGNDRADNKL